MRLIMRCFIYATHLSVAREVEKSLLRLHVAFKIMMRYRIATKISIFTRERVGRVSGQVNRKRPPGWCCGHCHFRYRIPHDDLLHLCNTIIANITALDFPLRKSGSINLHY